ncbi:beta-phosphoglucomutase family hydrolase [Candidatus Woesearchaeota archaeon]|nr:beta-phosphoglucomutase family hydrolase [Candidatus Woesearchaeota archaeon]
MKNMKFDAVIFDLDGVITQTASLHSLAWKQMFDNYLKKHSKKTGKKFREFTHEKDYLSYVDGKPRYKGVKSFLESRDIKLPYGIPSDLPNKETVCGLGNKKNKLFNELIISKGVDVFSSTVELIKKLQKKGVKIGVASSSKNCKSILESAGLLELFETRVDGVVSAELNLKGKPEPDIFKTACDNLNVTYDRAVVVEDAVSGVIAGKNGHFGLVIGVARENNKKELKIHGADIVVDDLKKISIEKINDWFVNGINKDRWSISYYDYSKEKETTVESLLTIGNGYFGTRGAMEEFKSNDFSYPGTYIAGVYNTLESEVKNRIVKNEDFVNCPNWTFTTFKIKNSSWFNLSDYKIIDIKRTLNFKTGILKKTMVVKDKKNRKTLIESERFACMHNIHTAGLKYKIKPLNYSEKIYIKTSLDANIINYGVKRYRQLSSKHLEHISEGADYRRETDLTENYLFVKTNQSDIKIAEFAKIKAFLGNDLIKKEPKIRVKKGVVDTIIEIDCNKGNEVTVEKIVSIYTSEHESESLIEKGKAVLSEIKNYKTLKERSIVSWGKIWEKADIKLAGDRYIQKLLRMHIYHLFVTSSPNSAHLKASIPARGLHGEAYRGHIFWDTIYILPFFNIHYPEISKSALMYRYERLNQARKYAKEHGYEGAMFPWQSGKSGKEETQTMHLNPMSGKWGPDYSSLQRHVSLATAYNIWNYYWTTLDKEFIREYGAEMLFEICRFWLSKAEKTTDNRYSIKKIMGPDEFHEHVSGSEEEGLEDNFYTNVMASWTFSRAVDIINELGEDKNKIFEKINLSEKEIQKWKRVSESLKLNISENGIFEQFKGYFKLKEIDWDMYKKQYDNIQRMDRILKAEGKSADEYKVAKQADVLMTFYNLSSKQVKEVLNKLKYKPVENFLKKNFEYYVKRTSHGSTLSKVVHSYLLNLIGKKDLSYKFYVDALESDYVDVQGGTTGEGIHTGVMAGTIIVAIKSYAGLDLNDDIIKINPDLPKTWKKIEFNIRFRDATYFFKIDKQNIKIQILGNEKKEIKIGDNIHVIEPKSLIDDTWEIFKRGIKHAR